MLAYCTLGQTPGDERAAGDQSNLAQEECFSPFHQTVPINGANSKIKTTKSTSLCSRQGSEHMVLKLWSWLLLSLGGET